MSELLAVFRSRSQAMDCMNKMRVYRVPAQLINTPKEANVGCGLSLRIPMNFAPKAKTVIAHGGYSAFYGYLKLDVRGGKITVRGF